ncbi:hypothetical protein TNCT_435241 [Trichonephila clavata]|uniref:Uncharacterized protein n=1 Tax=Trichonephila clavata TaxID=2740835 RepID=A0A8X6F1F0_TRICU|nr:hypothetical protein TNCT_435241 [Trichonephila clavata]
MERKTITQPVLISGKTRFSSLYEYRSQLRCLFVSGDPGHRPSGLPKPLQLCRREASSSRSYKWVMAPCIIQLACIIYLTVIHPASST